MSYSLLWCLPRKHYDHCRSQWDTFAKQRYHHHWIKDANDIQNLSIEAISSIQFIIGANNSQKNTTLQLIQKWSKPVQSIWLVEFSHEWISAYRSLFTHCLPLNFTSPQLREIEQKLFANTPPLSNQKLMVVEKNNNIQWMPWNSVQQIIFKTEEVHIISNNQRQHIGIDFVKKIVGQLEKKAQFFPVKLNHFINLNSLREIVKLDRNEYYCSFYSDNGIGIDYYCYQQLRKYLSP